MFKDARSGSRSFKTLLCLLIITALTFSSFGLGCSMLPSLKSPAAPKENSTNKDSAKPKPPEELASMLTSLNSITQTLLDQAGMTKNPPEQLSPQNQNQRGKENTGQTGQVSPGAGSQEQDRERTQGTGDQNRQSAANSGKNPQKGADKDEDSKNQKPAEARTAEPKAGQQQGMETGTAPEAPMESQQPWSLVDQMIQGLHQQWNALEPNIIKVGAKPELIAGFETQLEKLTKEATGRRALPTLIEDNELYKFFADIEQLFETQVPPEIHRLRYNLNAILLQIKASDWTAAKLHLHELQEEWKYAQPRMTEADPGLTSQFDYSLTDLEQVVSKEDGSLAEIKARICLNNLGELESKLGQKKNGSNQGQSQNQNQGENQNQNQSQGQGQSTNLKSD